MFSTEMKIYMIQELEKQRPDIKTGVGNGTRHFIDCIAEFCADRNINEKEALNLLLRILRLRQVQ